MRRFRPFTYANVASTLALFMALSGTSYALIITSKQIKNESITSTDIKDSTITTAELALDSVTSSDIKDSTIRLRDLNSEVKNKHQETVFMQRPTFSGAGQTIPGDGAVNVAYMNLPAGKYLAIASLQLEGGLGDPNSQYSGTYDVSCSLRDPGGLSTTRVVDLNNQYYDQAELTLTLAHDNSGEGLLIDCTRTGSVPLMNGPWVANAELDVIPVDTLTVRSAP